MLRRRCHLAAAGAHTISFLIPYFGYGTADRATKSGEVVTAKTRALLLSSVPQAGSGNRAFVLDAHAEGLPYYFEGDLRPFHLYAESVVLPAIAELGGSDFVLATVDAGRAKWVGRFADALGVDTAIVLKRRLDGSHTQVVATDAPVKGRRVVVFDDMIRSGGSLLAASRAYLDAGATSVAAVATHGVFSLPSPRSTLEAIKAAGLVDRIVVTDSHPNAQAAVTDDFMRVISCASVLAEPFLARKDI